MRASLLRAYRETRYEVGGIALRVGQRSAAMDEMLAAHGVREAVFITAYNPFSRLRPSGWNRRMQRQLARALHRRPLMHGNGSWRGWSEAHLVVFGDHRPARGIARRFRQNGIVIVKLRQTARLLLTSRLA